MSAQSRHRSWPACVRHDARVLCAEQHGDPPRSRFRGAQIPRRRNDSPTKMWPAKARSSCSSTRWPLETAAPYAAEDADVTLQTARPLCGRRSSRPARWPGVYSDIEQPLVEVLLRIEENGVLVDRNAAASAEQRIRKRKMAKVETEVHGLRPAAPSTSAPRNSCSKSCSRNSNCPSCARRRRDSRRRPKTCSAELA